MSAPVTITLMSDGQQLDVNLPLLHLEVWKEINRIPSAQITVSDGSISGREFSVSQRGEFDPGKTVEIIIRREDNAQSQSRLFKGMVVSQTVEASGRHSQLTVELRDAVHAMSTARRSRIFNNLSDSDIWRQLLDSYSIQVENIQDTGHTHIELVQYDCSDWDFVLLRAEANGMFVNVHDGSVSITRLPELDKNSQLRYEYGMSDILDLEMKADAARAAGAIHASFWETEEQATSDEEEGEADDPVQGNLNPKSLSSQMGTQKILLRSAARHTRESLKAWADGRLLRNRLALYRGRLGIIGRADVNLLDTIRLLGISNVFNGHTLITGLRHFVAAGAWRTDIQFGLSEEPYLSMHPDAQSSPAHGLTAPLHGLHIGVVDSHADDPERQFRVPVRLPHIGEENQIVWARQARPDAGPERGFFFHPEPGDEVVLGFLHNDPSQALILGSLHSSAHALPLALEHPEENNFIKGLQTREGIQMRFDDETKTLTIVTANDQQVILNGQDKTIQIQDGNNNQIIMGDSGLQLKSGGDILIEASGKVEIKGAQVDVK